MPADLVQQQNERESVPEASSPLGAARAGGADNGRGGRDDDGDRGDVRSVEEPERTSVVARREVLKHRPISPCRASPDRGAPRPARGTALADPIAR